MESFAVSFVGDPLRYIGYLLSAVAALGVILVIAGFSGGIKHIFTYSESAVHMEHARTRLLWGLYLCMVTLGIWELILVIAGDRPLSTLILVLILTSPAWAPWLKHTLSGTSAGH